MFKIDKTVMLALILLDAFAIVIGMVAGPLSHNSLSLGASISAGIISVVIILYGIFSWKKSRR